MLVFVGGRGRVMGGRRRGLGSTERGLLESSEGGVEGTTERLGECANVFGGGESAECGHGWNWIGMTNSTERGGCGPEVYLNVLATIAYLRERLGGENKSRVSDWLPQRLLGPSATLSRAIFLFRHLTTLAFSPHVMTNNVMANQRSSSPRW